MTDRIRIEGMVFEGTHGVHEHEQRDAAAVRDRPGARPRPGARRPQRTTSTRTIDYSAVFTTCRGIVETTSFRLIEALAQRIADEVLATYHPDEVTVRIRKPAVDLGGTFRAVGIEIVRRRDGRAG